MISLLYILLGLCFLMVVLTVVAIVWSYIIVRRNERHLRLLHDKYIESVSAIVQGGREVGEDNFPAIGLRRSKLLLGQIISRLGGSTYGYNELALRQIVTRHHIDSYFEHRAAVTRALKRAYYIKILSRMPISEGVVRNLERYTNDHNPYVRLYALILVMNHEPDTTISILEGHRHKLNDFDLSQISTLLLNKFVPVGVIEPLLDSSRLNHILLGLDVVRRYGYKAAAQRVMTFVDHPVPQVRESALYTLVTLKLPLSDSRIVAVVMGLSRTERKYFYRLLVAEGYSLRALHEFITLDKDGLLGDYIARAMISRKRTLSRRESVIT